MKFSLPTLRASLGAFALLVSAAATSAHAQTVITSLPYTISASGTYVLAANLVGAITSGSLITINASNVTLDMRNFYISGPFTGSGNLTGVYANERANVTVKNGTVAFCATGVDIEGNNTATSNAVNARIENMRVTYCYFTGIQMQFTPASRIRKCQISQIGVNSTATYRFGINTNGVGITIQDNTISDIVAPNSGASTTYGIGAGPGIFVFQNQISSAGTGVDGGIYQDNLISGCATPTADGTNGGGNVSDNNTISGSTPSARSADAAGKVRTGKQAND